MENFFSGGAVADKCLSLLDTPTSYGHRLPAEWIEWISRKLLLTSTHRTDRQATANLIGPAGRDNCPCFSYIDAAKQQSNFARVTKYNTLRGIARSVL